MQDALCVQGRILTEESLNQIRSLIAEHPLNHRNRLSQDLAQAWNWRTDSGCLKDMAARTLLLKLHRRGWITLPPPRRAFSQRRPIPPNFPEPGALPAAIAADLRELTPLTIELLDAKHADYPIFFRYLAHHHYLGYRGPVGERLAYLARDSHGRDLACLLFGAAAWKTASRDQFIGWDPAVRAKRLNWVTNNTRFLILPWVRVPHLASHLLGLILRRLSADWKTRYNHPVYLVETFVERHRFQGTCYRAANWTCVGQTQGRSRQDCSRALSVPVKDVYLYPLTPHFRQQLCRVDN